jgi:hypothetical protein
MKNVSQAFLNVNKQVHFGRFFGEVKFDPVHSGNTGFEFTATDLVNDSVKIAMIGSDTSDLSIGGVNLGKLELAFLPGSAGDGKDPDYFKQAMISLWYEISDGLSWESFKVGDYYVKNTVYENRCIYLTAYDGLCLFDVPFDGRETGTFFQMLKQAVDRVTMMTFDISLHLGFEEEEIEALPNGDYNYTRYPINDIVTYRDMLFWIAQSLGGFFYIDENGGLRLWSYFNFRNKTVTHEIEYDERIAGSSRINDFLTGFDGVEINDLQNNLIVTDDVDVMAQKTYSLGNNPFWQFLTDEEKTDFLRNLKYILYQDAVIRPYKVELASAPIFDLGDKLLFTGGDWEAFEETPTIVHSWEWSNDILTLQAFGQDRQNASSSSANKMGQMADRSKTIQYYYYEGTSEKTLNAQHTEISLGTVTFTANASTQVDIIAQSNPKVQTLDNNAEYEIEYYWEYDEVEVHQAFESKGSIIDGFVIHSLPLFAHVNAPGVHTITLKARWLDGQNCQLKWLDTIKNITILVKGQNLAMIERWNGIFQLSDGFNQILPTNQIEDLDWSMDQKFIEAMSESIFERVEQMEPENNLCTFTESIDLTIEEA